MLKKIRLTKGKFAIVDSEDFEWLNQWKWYYSSGYAKRDTGGRNNKQRIYMHRQIMNYPKEVDHINRNKLDNRKNNLRVCTHSENLQNSNMHKNNAQGIKGIYFRKDRKPSNKRWYSRIMQNGKDIHLGHFYTKEEAVEAYNLWMKN